MKITAFGLSAVKHCSISLKGRKKSSQEWLIRQLKDPYVEKAKISNYRCRSAFKLLEIDERFKLFERGMCVIDCGAAPGSWSQVAVRKVNSSGDESKPVGTVVAIDLLPIYPIPGATVLGKCDFTLPESQMKIKNSLNDKGVDVVLSDMAPNASGVKSIDQENILYLAYAVTRFSFEVLKCGGSLLFKLWDGNGTQKLEEEIKPFFSSVRRVKPLASRSDSSELFFLCRGFSGVEKPQSNQ